MELEGLGVVWAVKHYRPYLYGHHCVVYTDHEALKSLLNTPQPSGKLARWGLSLQEMDLEILYRPGKGNSNADALSRSPVADVSSDEPLPFQAIAVLQAEDHAEGREAERDVIVADSTLATEQRKDAELSELICYLETGTLPPDEKKAREFALTKSQYLWWMGCCIFLSGISPRELFHPKPVEKSFFMSAMMVHLVVT